MQKDCLAPSLVSFYPQSRRNAEKECYIGRSVRILVALARVLDVFVGRLRRYAKRWMLTGYILLHPPSMDMEA